MTLFRYHAVPIAGGAKTAGEFAGESAHDVRASLRRAGLQVIDLRAVRNPRAETAATNPFRTAWTEHLRRRRAPLRAELFDGLATMLKSGLPMLDAVESLLRSRRRGKAQRSMLLHVREALRGGWTLGKALRDHPGWFDAVEVAMVEAGQQGGHLPDVLARLSERQERAGELSHKLTGALAYPCLVLMLGLAVLVFLSTKTLPDLVQILADARLEAPALTLRVMAVGRGIAVSWPFLFMGIVALLAAWIVLRAQALRRDSSVVRALGRVRPDVMKKADVARVATGLARLVSVGVPIVDALRVLAPTSGGVALSAHLQQAAREVEAGKDVGAALSDARWFDDEFSRLLEIGQVSGELPAVLERLGDRYQRSAARAIDRLASLLEPAAILALAVLVGTVAMAAVLPLFRLQEVF